MLTENETPSKAVPRSKSKARKKMTPEERKHRRESAAFSRRIRLTFTNAGFAYLATNGIHRSFGNKTGELDAVFVWENVIVICEDTLSAPSNIKNHLKNKKLLTDEIERTREDTIEWLTSTFAERLEAFSEYDAARYRIFHLYFSKNEVGLNKTDQALFSPIKVVELPTLNYLSKMSSNIRHSARTDIFRFLGLSAGEIGSSDSADSESKIRTPIIYPVDNTGLKNNVRLVSFMMSPETLISNGYVLRKDNWEESIQLYQRLIEKDRIQSIRRFVAEKQTTFFNNIIVSLPEEISFEDEDGQIVPLSDISDYSRYKMRLPNELNSICIIDGQHRVYAHYKSAELPKDGDQFEKRIAKLRSRFHLLVTGLIFPSEMGSLERRKYESQIFLDINSNARPVPADVLLFIETLKDPFSPLGIARQVLLQLNEDSVFKNQFQLSLMDDSKIKVASIIKFALRYLVSITRDLDQPSLFQSWAADNPNEATALEANDSNQLDAFVKYCAETLDTYFKALRTTRRDDWSDESGKIRSVTSLNGFIMALRRSLPEYGVRHFEQYKESFERLQVSFKSDEFPYSSSQYAKFSRDLMPMLFPKAKTTTSKDSGPSNTAAFLESPVD